MKKTFTFSTLTLFASALAVFASATAVDLPPLLPTGAYAVGVYARDASTGSILANVTVFYRFEQRKGLSVLVAGTEQTNENGLVTAYLDAGTWSFFAEVDNYSTPGKDFISVSELNVSKDFSFTAYFQEVGSATGAVVDEQNNLVPNAVLALDCVKAVNTLELNEKLYSDANGNFLLRFVPTGVCRITASKDSKTGFVEVNLKRGEFKQTRIKLENIVSRENATFKTLLLPFVVLTIFFLLFFYFKRAGKSAALKTRKTIESRSSKTAKVAGNELKTTEKMRMVLNALNERERAISELLLANGGRMKQAKIARELLMPKTSLLRAVQSLEKRNIVRTTPLGKHKIVEFTDWFKNL